MVAGKKEETKRKPAGAILRETAELPPPLWDQARRLAAQLKDKPILPLIGAGASVDCGMDLAGPVAERMYGWYSERSVTGTEPSDLKKHTGDLGMVADAIFSAGDQAEVVEALALANPTEWPDADHLPAHFCSYRLLARLARENFISEAITLNYDCCFERGLKDEGFNFESWKLRGRTWLDHATVVTDGASHVRLDPRGQLVLTKAHGCAATYRRVQEKISAEPEEGKREALQRKADQAIVVRRGQLLDWRTDLWARDLFADRARRHVILLIGVSGQDPVIQVALTRILEEVYGHLEEDGTEPCKVPRVVAIDTDPNTVALTGLLHQGCDCRPADANAVTSLTVPTGGSVTAVFSALTVEMLALHLQAEAGYSPPSDPQERVVSLLIAAPASLRWTYLLERRRTGAGLGQRANLEHAGERGYVPLRADSGRVAESLRLRHWLRGQLGFEADETVEEALAGYGFVVRARRGRAFMPLGITAGELRSIPDADLLAADRLFKCPTELEPVLVARDGSGVVGRVVRTGQEVSIP